LAGEDEIFLKINKYQEKETVIGVRNIDGQLLGYYERFETVTDKDAPADASQQADKPSASNH
jgi:hypothetical protein